MNASLQSTDMCVVYVGFFRDHFSRENAIFAGQK